MRLDPRAAAKRRSRSAGKMFPCERRLTKHVRTLFEGPQRGVRAPPPGGTRVMLCRINVF
jgi:hypothetical protein